MVQSIGALSLSYFLLAERSHHREPVFLGRSGGTTCSKSPYQYGFSQGPSPSPHTTIFDAWPLTLKVAYPLSPEFNLGYINRILSESCFPFSSYSEKKTLEGSGLFPLYLMRQVNPEIHSAWSKVRISATRPFNSSTGYVKGLSSCLAFSWIVFVG